MLYAPLHTVIWEDGTMPAVHADQPSTQFLGFGIPAVAEVGIRLDRAFQNLLDVLDAEQPR